MRLESDTNFRVCGVCLKRIEHDLRQRMLQGRAIPSQQDRFRAVFIFQLRGLGRLIFARFGIGAPTAAMVLEELIALGASAFLSIGVASALQPGLGAGDLVVCERGKRTPALWSVGSRCT